MPTIQRDRPPTDTRYAMMLQGECLFSVMPNGAVAVVDSTLPLRKGDIVCVWWRPEHVQPGRLAAIVQQLKYVPKGKTVALKQFNPPHVYREAADKIAAIHRVIGWMDVTADVGGTVKLKSFYPGDRTMSDAIEPYVAIDQFVLDLVSTEKVGPCTRLVFSCTEGGIPVVISKLVIPTENLRAIGLQLLALAEAGKATGPLSTFETQGLQAS